MAITTSGCQVVGQGTCMPSLTTGYAGTPRIGGGWGKNLTAATIGAHPYIDATAFTVPNQSYQIGSAPRTGAYNLFGPGSYDLDSGLGRTFKITETVNFVFRATATNVTNSVHFGINSLAVTPAPVVSGINSVGTNTNSNFGTIGSQVNTPRDFQFSGKINF